LRRQNLRINYGCRFFGVGNFIGEFVNEGGLILAAPLEIVVDQICIHQFRVGERHILTVGPDKRDISVPVPVLQLRWPNQTQMSSLDVLGALQNGLTANFIAGSSAGR